MSTPTLSAKRSLAAFPAGSNGEFGLPDNDAIVIQRGEGCELWDATGRRYLDFSMGWGSALIGHGRREVADAVRKQCFDGFNFAYVTQSSVELAEEIIRISPACQQLRFCSSGSEATQYCARIARAATGRSTLMKFEGAYHGSHVIGVANLFLEQPPDYPLAVSNCDGCRHAERDLLIAPFNDLEVTTRIAEEYQSQLAGVIVEPLQRCLPPAPGFLEGLRELTQRLDIPLIFDEVVTGFRLAYGGAQEYYEVIPDLVAYGKALGGGFPIGAYGGRAELMNLVPRRPFGQRTSVRLERELDGRKPDQLGSGKRHTRRVENSQHVRTFAALGRILSPTPASGVCRSGRHGTDYRRWSTRPDGLYRCSTS